MERTRIGCYTCHSTTTGEPLPSPPQRSRKQQATCSSSTTDTCTAEPVQSLKRTQAQKSINSRISTHHVSEFIQIAHSPVQFRSGVTYTARPAPEPPELAMAQLSATSPPPSQTPSRPTECAGYLPRRRITGRYEAAHAPGAAPGAAPE